MHVTVVYVAVTVPQIDDGSWPVGPSIQWPVALTCVWQQYKAHPALCCLPHDGPYTVQMNRLPITDSKNLHIRFEKAAWGSGAIANSGCNQHGWDWFIIVLLPQSSKIYNSVNC